MRVPVRLGAGRLAPPETGARKLRGGGGEARATWRSSTRREGRKEPSVSMKTTPAPRSRPSSSAWTDATRGWGRRCAGRGDDGARLRGEREAHLGLADAREADELGDRSGAEAAAEVGVERVDPRPQCPRDPAPLQHLQRRRRARADGRGDRTEELAHV